MKFLLILDRSERERDRSVEARWIGRRDISSGNFERNAHGKKESCAVGRGKKECSQESKDF